ncbi:MAG: hypothetical protein JWL70_2528 [Acidimicrobiia bacterium]|nr:hypothetical protein [Acidimicrobiia bacterium]
MTRRRSQRGRGDRGVTLVELLITISLSGVILGAVSAALLFAMRVQAPTAGRLNDSHSEQLMAGWLPADLASMDAVGGGDTVATTAAGCATAVAGSNVVRLRVTDDSTAVVSYISYRIQQAALVWQLTRTTCVAGGAASTRLLIDGLPSAAAVSVSPPMTSASSVGTLTMTVASSSSGGGFMGSGDTYTFSLQGNPRGTAVTAVTAPPAGSPVTVLAPTTTLPPCTAPSASPSSATRSGSSLSAPINFSITVSAACSSSMTLSFTPGSGAAVSVPLSATGLTRTATVPTTAYSWTSGTKVVTVKNNGVAVSTFNLVVT